MRSTSPPPQRSALRAVGNTAVLKILVMGLSGVLGIVTSRMIISNFGVDAYAQYGLLSSLSTLLPFADLGIAAVVINTIAASEDVRRDELVHRTLVTALRVLVCAGAVIVGVSGAITAGGWWPALLGNGLVTGGDLAAGICLAVFGLALPLTVGQRAVVGMQRSGALVTSQAVVAPFMAVSILLLVTAAVPAGSYLAVLSYIGNALVSVVCLVVAARLMSPQIGRALRDTPRIRRVRRVPILSTTWPMLVQMMALPVAMQTDRLLISHVSDGPELAQYNLAVQLFGLVLQTIAAAGVALWPVYARARAESRIESPIRPMLVFLAGGLLVGSALAVASPFLADVVSDGRIELPWLLVVAFVAFVGLQAMKYPLGMYMTDRRGLTFQVAPILVLVPVNLGLSWLLIGPLGPAGTVIGSLVSVGLCQVVPNLVYVLRDLRRRRADRDDEVPSVDGRDPGH